MQNSVLHFPNTDPTPIFELFRGNHSTEILVAAVCHLQIFEHLHGEPQTWEELKQCVQLEERPMQVIMTALLAMGLLHKDSSGRYSSTELAAEHLGDFLDYGINGYVGLAADAPGSIEFLDRLRTNKPRGAEDSEEGAAFIFKEGMESAMHHQHSARHLTMALAGRAKNVAPYLAKELNLEGTRTLLDLGAGSGIYSIALVQKNPTLKAIIMDSEPVLNVAEEFVREYGVEDRVELKVGDMFADKLPKCDAVLLSNVLHDWDIPECETLLKRSGDCLGSGGRVFIHDVFLNDAKDGPLPIALYSAALFTLTEGRAYSAEEYRNMLKSAGLNPSEQILPTFVHCGVLEGRKA
jgi:predicted O-methyltransferase YrrM